jgi:dihydroneopterin aldolase
MLIIASVENFKSRIPVGWFLEERTIKTEVLISVNIGYEIETVFDNLDGVIDYQVIDEIIWNSSLKEVKLLEMLAQDIINQCLNRFSVFDLKLINVKIKKPVILLNGVDSDFHVIFLEKKF